MSLVRIIGDPADLSAYSEHSTDDILGLLEHHFPTWPPTARIYAGAVAVENDVTPSTEEQLQALRDAKHNDMFYVVVYPGDPVTAIIAVVATLALTAAVLLFLTPKIPTLDSQSQSSNNALGERVNKPRPNSRIEDIFGEVVSVPTLLTVPLLIFENNLEVEYCLMCVGRGAYAISEVLDGDTPIGNIAGAAVAFYEPFTRPGNGQPFLQIGSAIDQAPVNAQRSNEVNGQILRMPNNGTVTGKNDITFTGPDTITHSSTDYAFTDFFAPDAQVTITGSTSANGSLDGTYQMLAVAADKITLANPNAVNSNWGKLGTGSAAQTTAVSLAATGTPVIGPFTIDHDGCTQLVFNFVAQQGVYRLNETGKNRDREVNIQVAVQPTDRAGNAVGSVVNGSITLKGNGNDRRPKGATLRVNVPKGRFFSITGMRTTGPYQDTDETVVDEIRWRDLFSTSVIPGDDYGDVTVLQSRTYATAGASTVKERKLNCRAVRKVRQPKRGPGSVPYSFAAATMPQGASLKRASAGTRVGSNGAATTDGVDVPRFDYDPSNLKLRGLLVEPAATNLLYPSNDISNASWTLTALTASSADTVMETATSATHLLTNTRASVQSGTTYTFSVEAGELANAPKRYLMIHLRSQAFGSDMLAVFDVGTGTVVATTAGLVTSIQAAPNGRWLCSATATATATTTVTSRIFLRNLPTASQGAYAGATNAGMRLSGVQIEANPGPTARVATTTAAASRSADVLTLTLPASYSGQYSTRFSYYGGATQDVPLTFNNGVATVNASALNQYKVMSATVQNIPNAGPRDPAQGFEPQLMPSRDAADIFCHMALDPYIGARAEAELDLEQIYATVNDIRSYFGFNDVADFSTTFDQDNISSEEMLQTVAQAIFCTAYRQGSLLRLFFECSTTDAIMLFNHRNKTPRSETRTVKCGYLNDYDGVELDYVSGEDGAKLTTYIPADQSATKPKKLELIGIVDRRGDGAVPMLHANRAWNKIRYQNTTTEFESVGEASELVLTQLVEVADNTRSGTLDGEALGQDGLVLMLSQPFNPAANTQYAIHLQLPSGRVQVINCTAGPSPMSCTLAAAPDETLDFSEDLWALPVYTIVAPGGRPSGFLISEKGAFDGKRLSVQAYNYDERYYQADQMYKGATA